MRGVPSWNKHQTRNETFPEYRASGTKSRGNISSFSLFLPFLPLLLLFFLLLSLSLSLFLSLSLSLSLFPPHRFCFVNFREHRSHDLEFQKHSWSTKWMVKTVLWSWFVHRCSGLHVLCKILASMGSQCSWNCSGFVCSCNGTSRINLFAQL